MKRFLTITALFLLTGCSQSGPSVHPVKGQIQLGGDATPLAGHTIEVALASDRQVRASGEIRPDGNFQLESLLEGKIRRGALEGKYVARLVLADDDLRHKQATVAGIDPRYLQFESSGLSLEVPAKIPVQWEVKRR